MKNSRYIDIIIPIYNVENYLRQCVDSVINQTYKRINVILVDDGSPDNSPKICDEYAIKYNNVKVLHKENGGLSDARNQGMRLCKSELIMFLDSDDWLEENAIEEMIHSMDIYDADVVCTESILEFDNGVGKKNNSFFGVLNSIQATKAVLNRRINVSAWGKLYKRSLFEGIEYPKHCLHEDIPVIFPLLMKANKIVIMDVPLHHYRQQYGSISRNSFKPQNHALYKFIKEVSFVVQVYPSLREDYEGFYLYYLKSLLVLFNSNDTKVTYKSYYDLYVSELKKDWKKIFLNRTLSLKDKLSIPLLLTPLYENVKQLYRRFRV